MKLSIGHNGKSRSVIQAAIARLALCKYSGSTDQFIAILVTVFDINEYRHNFYLCMACNPVTVYKLEVS